MFPIGCTPSVLIGEFGSSEVGLAWGFGSNEDFVVGEYAKKAVKYDRLIHNVKKIMKNLRAVWIRWILTIFKYTPYFVGVISVMIFVCEIKHKNVFCARNESTQEILFLIMENIIKCDWYIELIDDNKWAIWTIIYGK